MGKEQFGFARFFYVNGRYPPQQQGNGRSKFTRYDEIKQSRHFTGCRFVAGGCLWW